MLSRTTFLLKSYKSGSKKHRFDSKNGYAKSYSHQTSLPNMKHFSYMSKRLGLALGAGVLSAFVYLGSQEERRYKAQTTDDLVDEGNYSFEEIVKKAEEGNGVAQFYLAIAYLKGEHGLSKNVKKAVELFHKAYEQGVPEAALNLGVMYVNADDVKRDVEKGVFYLQEAASLGSIAAYRNLGHMYYSGKGVSRDLTKARQYFLKGAEEGEPYSQFIAGIMYHLGQGGPKDYEKALSWYLKAAENGVSDAQYNIALSYHRGVGVPSDTKKAIYWYRKASEQGDSEAQHELACLLRGLDSTTEELKESKYWLSRAADNGNPKSQRLMGSNLLRDSKFEEAFEMFSKCSRSQVDDCKIELALLILDGKGVPTNKKDPKEAFRLMEVAAFNGSTVAQTKLAAMYLMGLGTPQNYEKALYYFKLAAEKGDRDAQFHLGIIYQEGKGVEQSLSKAKQYFENAAALGHELALHNLKSFYEESSTATQILRDDKLFTKL